MGESDEPQAPVSEAQTPATEPTQPQRVCRKCAAISHARGDFCPHCGAPYARRGPLRKTRTRIARWSRKRKALVFGLPLLLLLLAAGVGAYLKIDHDNQVQADRERQEEARRQAAAERQREREQAAQEERELQADLDRIDRQLRRKTVRGLERAVTEDAQDAVNDGILDGPILRTECDPAPGETPMDLSVSTAAYDCLAVYKIDTDGTYTGWTYTANINFDTGRYSWSLGEE
jgi:uncharacterized protein HemX